jgi:hypothetical protein
MISKYIPKEYTIAQLAYLAGIIDGEGSITIGCYAFSKKTGVPHFHTKIEVTSTDKVLIDWLADNFGGGKSTYTDKQMANNCKRRPFRWTIHSDRVKHLCECTLPYLIIKKEQAQIMIDMRNTFEKTRMRKGDQGTQPIEKEVLDLRYELFNKLKALHIR